MSWQRRGTTLDSERARLDRGDYEYMIREKIVAFGDACGVRVAYDCGGVADVPRKMEDGRREQPR